jgi:hypothetical protein
LVASVAFVATVDASPPEAGIGGLVAFSSMSGDARSDANDADASVAGSCFV